jgi:AcrR family transcriptional regulator
MKHTRKPRQERSQASLARMISTAKRLMSERRNEDFTLQEVSVRGRVSIGSIYHVFDSKEDLVRAVIFADLEVLAATEQRFIARALRSCSSLDEFVPTFVNGYAKMLRDNALVLKLAMQRASRDAKVSGTGDREAQAAAEKATSALLTFRNEIAGEAQSKVNTAYQMIFAVLARHLSLDTRDPMAMSQDWKKLVEELRWMTLWYLKGKRPSE